MTLGEVILSGALLAAGAAIMVPRWRDITARLHAALVLAALAWLLTDFLAGTLLHRYTWDHTRTDYAWYYRMAGLWGGEAGTLLLWNAVVALAILMVRESRPRRFLLAFSGALALLGLLFRTFAATSPADLAQAPSGRGLADVLITPLMVIHPPIQFFAYGLLAVPAAFALASLWEPPADGAWAARAFVWARRAWFFATLGLGLGALWAYYVLSFGGYWAWDPVEASNLLPWLALTAFLHAGKQRMRGQGHIIAAPLLAYAAFLLTLFATFATRSGLWVSVHAFTDPTSRFEPDAAARMLAILDVHLPTRAFVALLSAAVFAGAGLVAARRLDAKLWGAALLALGGAALLAPADLWALFFHVGSLVTPLPVGLGILFAILLGLPFLVAFLRTDDGHAKLDLSVRTLMASAVVLLAVALGVVFLLNLQVVNGPDRSAFDARAPFVALPIASVVTLMLALAPLGKRGAVALAGGALAAGLAAAYAFPETRVLALAAPVCGAAAIAAALKLAHVQGSAAPRALRVAGILLLLASLLGFVQWSNPPTYLLGRDLPGGASLTLGLVGIALATLGLLGSIATFRARSRPLALLGAVSAGLCVGYGIGLLFAIVAFVLIARAPGEFKAGFDRGEMVRVRETGIYLVHLALVLGLLGYAASTYAQERQTFAAVPLDAMLAVADYDIMLGNPHVSADGGALDSFSLGLALAKDGRDAGAESMDFEWQRGSSVYSGRLEVRRTLAEDVYIRPLAFHTPDGWVGSDSAAGARVAASGVDAVTFSVSVLPLMSLVWAATWMMVIGMGFILFATRRGD